MVEAALRHRYSEMDASEHALLRHVLLHDFANVPPDQPIYLRNKLAQLMALLCVSLPGSAGTTRSLLTAVSLVFRRRFLHEYTHTWPDFFDTILPLARQGAETADMVVRFMLAIDEQVWAAADSWWQSRVRPETLPSPAGPPQIAAREVHRTDEQHATGTTLKDAIRERDMDRMIETLANIVSDTQQSRMWDDSNATAIHLVQVQSLHATRTLHVSQRSVFTVFYLCLPCPPCPLVPFSFQDPELAASSLNALAAFIAWTNVTHLTKPDFVAVRALSNFSYPCFLWSSAHLFLASGLVPLAAERQHLCRRRWSVRGGLRRA